MQSQIKDIVKRILINNNWGIYFKGKPLVEMPVAGAASIYKLNEVEISELEGAIEEEINKIMDNVNQQGETECQTKIEEDGSREM